MAAAEAPRVPLDRDRIVAAAVALADEEGTGALSMRRLAERLDAGVMSLYNHVANKDELLALMVDRVVAEIPELPPRKRPLEEVRRTAIATREVFVAHPWAPELWLRCRPGPARTRAMEAQLRRFAESGLAPDLAHHGYHAVTNHVLGYTLQELGMRSGHEDLDATARAYLAGLDEDAFPYSAAHVRDHVEGRTSSSFELVLDLILDGLVRLDEARSAGA